jgi:hypothetical protein
MPARTIGLRTFGRCQWAAAKTELRSMVAAQSRRTIMGRMPCSEPPPAVAAVLNTVHTQLLSHGAGAATVAVQGSGDRWTVRVAPRAAGAAPVSVVVAGTSVTVMLPDTEDLLSWWDGTSRLDELAQVLEAVFLGRVEAVGRGRHVRINDSQGRLASFWGHLPMLPVPWRWRRRRTTYRPYRPDGGDHDTAA